MLIYHTISTYVDILACMYMYALLMAMDGPYLVDYIQQGFRKDRKNQGIVWHRQELEDSMVKPVVLPRF